MCQHDDEEKTRQLLRRHRADDRNAFRDLYDLHGERVESVVSKTLNAEHDDPRVEDVCGKIWLDLLESLESYDEEEGCFHAWLHAVATNAALKALRGERRQRRLLRDLEARALEKPAFVPAPSHDELDRSQLAQDIRSAVDALPEEQREVFRLHHEKNVSLDEIAEQQDVGRRTVEKRLELALKKLRGLLRRYRPETLDGSL
jgi:RNA polymerase sigma-70 factor (ECF subfamily)